MWITVDKVNCTISSAIALINFIGKEFWSKKRVSKTEKYRKKFLLNKEDDVFYTICFTTLATTRGFPNV